MAISKVSSRNGSVLDHSTQKSSAQSFWQDLRRNRHRDAANSPPTLECLLSVCDGHSFKQSSALTVQAATYSISRAHPAVIPLVRVYADIIRELQLDELDRS